VIIETNPIQQSCGLKKYYEIQDKAASFVVKEVKDKDGLLKSFTQEWLSSLSLDVGNKVYEIVNEVSGMSRLKTEEKKSS
jgi:hypothetical protein